MDAGVVGVGMEGCLGAGVAGAGAADCGVVGWTWGVRLGVG